MTTLILISLGLFIVGFILGRLSEGSFDWECELELCSIISYVLATILFMTWGCLSLSDKEKTEEKKSEVVSDSIRVQDAIEKMVFVVSWKDEDGVWAGQNVKLIGKTEKNIGDTITINLK